MMADEGVPIWCFAGRDMSALTNDETGAQLPSDLGPWTLKKRIAMIGHNADEAEALELIREHGFCCFDASPVEPEA